MTIWKWRSEGHEQTRDACDTRASAVDRNKLLRLSAAEAQPSAQLRTRVLSILEDRIEHKKSLQMWLVPASAAVMVAVVALVLSYSRLRLPQPPSPLPIASKTASVRPVDPSPQKQVARQHKGPIVTRPREQNRQPESLQAKRPALTNELPIAQFDSLLYCDPFSCGDPMQVIRLEVPAASVGRAYRPLARNGFVNAEVIVGTDGLTRAVRFTK